MPLIYLLFSWVVQGPLPLHTGIDVPLLFQCTDLSQNSKCNCLVGTEVLPVDLPVLRTHHLKNMENLIWKYVFKWRLQIDIICIIIIKQWKPLPAFCFRQKWGHGYNYNNNNSSNNNNVFIYWTINTLCLAKSRY